MVRTAKPYELRFFHQVALGTLTIGPQAIRVRLLPCVGVVVAKNVAVAVNADSDVLIPVYLVVLECVERVALLGPVL